jgi:hypothetical protein
VGHGTPIKCRIRDPRCTCSRTPPWSFLHPHVLPPTVPIRSSLSLTQLPRYDNKQKSNQTTRPRNTVKREATRHRKNNYTERTQKEERLSPLGGCPIPGPKNRSGDSLSTSLSLSLASTSRVDRVDLYSLNRNGIGLSSS